VLPLAIGKPSGYWTVRKIRRFGYVASIGLPITNLSDIVPCLRDDVRLPFTNHQSLLTSHGRASGPTAAFSAARDFEKILGSGFEMIRISQCESASVFGL